PGTPANDVLPSNVVPMRRPQPARVALAAGQDFSPVDVDQPPVGTTAGSGDQTVASATKRTGAPPKPVTTPTTTTTPTVGQPKGGTRGRRGVAGTRMGRTYRIKGNTAAIRNSQTGYQVYEYRNSDGELLYVGKSGGAGGQHPISWLDRLRTDH